MTILNTYEEVKALVSVGMPEEQAERVVNLMERRNKILATKDDIRNLYDNVQKDIDSLRKDVQSDISSVKKDIDSVKEQMATKVDIEKIRVEIERMNTRIESHMVKTDKDYAWISKLGVAMFTVLLGILITSPNVSNFVHGILA